MHLIKPAPLPPRFLVNICVGFTHLWGESCLHEDMMGLRVRLQKPGIMEWFGLEAALKLCCSNSPAMVREPSTRPRYWEPHPAWPWAPLWSLKQPFCWIWEKKDFTRSSPAAQEGHAAMQRGLFVWITSDACRLPDCCLSMCQGTPGICFHNIPMIKGDWGGDCAPPQETPSLPTDERWIQPESTVLALPFVSSTQHFEK